MRSRRRLPGRAPAGAPLMLASQLMAAELYQESHPPARLYAGRGPGQRKGNPMSTRSPYPDVEVPEISLPRFVLDRSDERGAAVPLMGPADHGSASPLMGPAAAGTVTPLMGPADPATVTPLMGPRRSRHDGLAHGSRRPGHGHAADASKPVMRRADRRTDVSPGPAGGPGRPGWEQITAPGDRR